MRYSEARPDIQSGDIVAWQGRHWAARLIQRVTRSQYSHVAVVWRVSGRLFILEAVPRKGVSMLPLSVCPEFDWIATGVDWAPEAQGFALAQLGKNYSYVDAILAGLNIKMMVKDWWICSEYVREVVKKCNVHVPGIVQTPVQLIQHFRKQDCPIRFVEPDEVP